MPRKPIPLASHVCSFCGRKRADVDRLIQAPGVQICDVCVSFFNEALRYKRARFPMIAEDAPDLTLCVLHPDGRTMPVTGLDVYLNGTGPFMRAGGTWKEATGGEEGRLCIDMNPQDFVRRLGDQLLLGIAARKAGE